MALFLVTSATVFIKGPEVIHGIAIAFHDNRVKTMLSQQKYRAAAQELTAWSWLEPENQDLIRRGAEAHLLDRKVIKAYYYLEMLTASMAADDYKVCRLMALIQAERKNSTALDWANRAKVVAPPDREAGCFLVVAHVNRKAGKLKEARDGYRAVLERDIDHFEAKYYLADEFERGAILISFTGALKDAGNDFTEFTCTPEFVLKANLSAHK